MGEKKDALKKVMDQIRREQELVKTLPQFRSYLDDFPNNIARIIETNNVDLLRMFFSMSSRFNDMFRIAEKLTELGEDMREAILNHSIMRNFLKQIELLDDKKFTEQVTRYIASGKYDELMKIIATFRKTGMPPDQLKTDFPALSKSVEQDLEKLTSLLKKFDFYDYSKEQFEEFSTLVIQISQAKHPRATKFLLNMSKKIRFKTSRNEMVSRRSKEFALVEKLEIEAFDAIRNERHPAFSGIAILYIDQWPDIEDGWSTRALRIAVELAIAQGRNEIKPALLSIFNKVPHWSQRGMYLYDIDFESSDAIDIVIDAYVRLHGVDAFKVLYESLDYWQFPDVWKGIVYAIEKQGGDPVKAILKAGWYNEFEGDIDWPLFDDIVHYVHKRDLNSSMILIGNFLSLYIKPESIAWANSLDIKFKKDTLVQMLESNDESLQRAVCNYLIFFPKKALVTSLRMLLFSNHDYDEAVIALAAAGSSKDIDAIIDWMAKHHGTPFFSYDERKLLEIIELVNRYHTKLLRAVSNLEKDPDIPKRWYRLLFLASACIINLELRAETFRLLPYFYDIMFSVPFGQRDVPSRIWDFWQKLDYDRIDILARFPELTVSGSINSDKFEDQFVSLVNPSKFLEVVLASHVLMDKITTSNQFKEECLRVIKKTENIEVLRVVATLSFIHTSEFIDRAEEIFVAQDADILGRNPDIIVGLLTSIQEFQSRNKVIDKLTQAVESTADPNPLYNLLLRKCPYVLSASRLNEAFSKRKVSVDAEPKKDDSWSFAP